MNFVKMTILGGLVFLVPIIVAMVVLGKAFTIMRTLAEPFAAWLPIDSIGGVALANLLAVASIILACFTAGLATRSALAVKTIESLESGFLSSIPGYRFIKSMAEGFAGAGSSDKLQPIIARFDDAWQLAFEVERGADGQVVVYVPGAPDPWAGSVLVMTADRVQTLDLSVPAAVRNIRALGRGTTGMLRP